SHNLSGLEGGRGPRSFSLLLFIIRHCALICTHPHLVISRPVLPNFSNTPRPINRQASDDVGNVSRDGLQTQTIFSRFDVTGKPYVEADDVDAFAEIFVPHAG